LTSSDLRLGGLPSDDRSRDVCMSIAYAGMDGCAL
jgi:hypothetical protein